MITMITLHQEPSCMCENLHHNCINHAEVWKIFTNFNVSNAVFMDITHNALISTAYPKISEFLIISIIQFIFWVTMTLICIRTSEGKIVQVESELPEISLFMHGMFKSLNIDIKNSTVSRKLDSCKLIIFQGLCLCNKLKS